MFDEAEAPIIERGFAPSCGPITPRVSSISMRRAAREYPTRSFLWRYEVLAFHLQGGMQEVYRCYDNTLDRIVALKTPKEGVVDKRFNRGAQMVDP